MIFADVNNFMVTSDGISLFLQNFKNLDQLKIEKWLIYPTEAFVKLFS